MAVMHPSQPRRNTFEAAAKKALLAHIPSKWNQTNFTGHPHQNQESPPQFNLSVGHPTFPPPPSRRQEASLHLLGLRGSKTLVTSGSEALGPENLGVPWSSRSQPPQKRAPRPKERPIWGSGSFSALKTVIVMFEQTCVAILQPTRGCRIIHQLNFHSDLPTNMVKLHTKQVWLNFRGITIKHVLHVSAFKWKFL